VRFFPRVCNELMNNRGVDCKYIHNLPLGPIHNIFTSHFTLKMADSPLFPSENVDVHSIALFRACCLRVQSRATGRPGVHAIPRAEVEFEAE